MKNILSYLFGGPSVTKVLSKFTQLEKDLNEVLDFHSAQADFHAAEAEVQKKLSIQSSVALKAIQTLLGTA